jgi:NAD(P)-dependent dehydrogenase (short-subunit alcohol dehydrogenase family)
MKDDRLFGLGGRVAAIIGAGSGIGQAVALGCARQGATVRCLDVDEQAATATAAAITTDGGSADAAGLDITDAQAVDAALDRVVEQHGALDVVVCTPGVNVRKPILEYTDADFDKVVGLNLKGSFHVLRAAGRIMTARGRGSIILFSSIRAQVVEPGQSVYASTKAGIVQIVRTAAAEFGPSGVRVNAVGPGVVETPLTAPIQSKPKWHRAYAEKSVFNRWATAEEMVGPTVFLASDAASFVTGTLLMADGGWTAVDGRFDPM